MHSNYKTFTIFVAKNYVVRSNVAINWANKCIYLIETECSLRNFMAIWKLRYGTGYLFIFLSVSVVTCSCLGENNVVIDVLFISDEGMRLRRIFWCDRIVNGICRCLSRPCDNIKTRFIDRIILFLLQVVRRNPKINYNKNIFRVCLCTYRLITILL